MEFLLWAGFIVLVLGFLALDLGVFHRRAHVVETREALIWTAVWIVVSLAFSALIRPMYDLHWFGIGTEIGHELNGTDAALQFLTGYVIEKSLSLDNIFVIALIFTHFGVPREFQHRVLFWGILGALVLRAAMILAGAALLERFAWMTYVFGGILLLTAVKMLVSRAETVEPDRNPLVRLARRLFPVTSHFEGQKFFVRLADGRRAITPLFLVLLLVESTDVIFAVDSIPAIFAITFDPFIVFTSNVFAILGLRSLYFALASMMHRFRYLKASLVFLLAFVGGKMMLAHTYHLPAQVSLAIIAGILSVGILASLLHSKKDPDDYKSPLE